jgi:Type I phosphodiesterase / nucleotide pyrophosphatase
VLLAATLAAQLTVGLNGLAPASTSLTLGLAFWAGFLAVHATLGAAAVVVLALASLFRGAARLPEMGVRLFAGGFVLAALGLNAAALPSFMHLPGPERFRVFCPMALALSVGGLALAAGTSLERRAGLRLVSLLAGMATAGAFYPLRPQADVALAPARSTPPLLVVGLDGADWRYIEPLLARGELPHIAALRAAGTFGPLATLQPTLSPVVWTSIATGRLPLDHGVNGFLMKTLDPVDVALPDPLLWPRGIGSGILEDQLERRRMLREGPVGSEARRVAALWNIATAYGAPMAVVHWWATTDPEPILGSLISPRVYYAATEGQGTDEAESAVFPSSLYAEALRRVTRPGELPYTMARRFAAVSEADWSALAAQPLRHEGHLLQMLPYTLSLHETTRRLALFALERGRQEADRPIDLLVLFRLVDMVCHKALVDSDLVPRPVDEAETIFTPAVAEAYRTVDRALGELTEALPGANVVVVSDHGFDIVEGRHGRRADHGRAPDGIFLGAGPAFRRGRLDGLGVLDVMPLLLNLKGFPQPKDLPGRLPIGALTPAWQGLPVPPEIASYAFVRRGPIPAMRGAGRLDEAEMEGLRALGYIN